jgi:hypothetical protein
MTNELAKRTPIGHPGSPLIFSLLAAAAAVGGVYLVGLGSPSGISGGVLVLIVSLASMAVLLGGTTYGPDVEGRLDMSSRIGLGLLGGTLGAVLSAVVQWGFELLRIPLLFGVALSGAFTAGESALHLVSGAVWGALFGILLPLVPGRTVPSRGVLFSLVPTLYVLLKVLPIDRDVGWFGVDLGSLTFLFVALFNLIWGLVAATTLAWGERTELGPVSRYLGEPPVASGEEE